MLAGLRRWRRIFVDLGRWRDLVGCGLRGRAFDTWKVLAKFGGTGNRARAMFRYKIALVIVKSLHFDSLRSRVRFSFLPTSFSATIWICMPFVLRFRSCIHDGGGFRP